MNQLEFAIRQYQETSPVRSEFDPDSNSRLAVWYAEDVAPVLKEYSRRPQFRRYASWPIKELQTGVKTELRSLTEQVDRSLVNCAQSVLEIVQTPSIFEVLCSEFPPRQLLAKQEFSTGVVSEPVIGEGTLLCDPILDLLNQLKRFASRPWEDLVNIQDYFGTQPKVSPNENGIAIYWADSILSLNPRFLPIGNFVVRSMMERIRPSRKLFSESKGYLLKIEKKLDQPLWTKVENDHGQYEANYTQLEQALNSSAKQLVDACVSLTQIYVATDDEADVSWLGLDPQTVQCGARDVKFRFKGLRGPEVHDRIATHLKHLQNLYESEQESEIEIEELIARRSLAVNLNERVVYWKGNPLPVSKLQFKFLHLLAERVIMKRTVIGNDLDAAKSMSDSALSSLVGRLRKAIPPELAVAIKNEGEGYYLDLPGNEVVVIASQE